MPQSYRLVLGRGPMGDEGIAPTTRSVGQADRAWIDPQVLLNVFEHSPVGLLIGHPDGRILHANKKACEMFGCSEDDLCRVGRAGITYPGDPLMPVMLEQRRQTGRAEGIMPMHQVGGAGTPFVAELTSVVFETPGGTLRSIVIIRDVTRKVRTELRLAAYDEIAETLLATTDFAAVQQLLVRHARLIFESDIAVLSSVDPDGTVTVEAVDGDRAKDLLGQRYPSGGAVQQVIASKEAMSIDDFTAVAQLEDGRNLGVGPAIALPVISNDVLFGLLLLARVTGVPYGSRELSEATQFAQRAAFVMGVAQVRAERERRQAETAEQLQRALNTRIVIEQAKGIVAATRNIGIDEAFDRLRKYARSHSIRIHDVAIRVVERTLLP